MEAKNLKLIILLKQPSNCAFELVDDVDIQR